MGNSQHENMANGLKKCSQDQVPVLAVETWLHQCDLLGHPSAGHVCSARCL
jgi:hypothetical protein